MTHRRLLVTGGAGFIGTNFVRRVLADGDARVVVVDKLTYAGNLDNLEEFRDDERFAFERVDIADGPEVARVLEEHRPDAVVNFAAESHVDRSIDSPAEFIRTNVVGTFTLAEACRRYLSDADAGADEGSRFRFVHVSTDEVYGSLGAEGAFREDTPYAPNSPYAASKASADHIVRAYQETYGLPTLVTNCSNNYGPFQFPEKLIPLMILNAVEAKPLPIYGDGGNVRDWLHVEDHCDAILTILERGEPGEKFNIGSRNERTNLEVVDALCDALEASRPAADNPALREAGKSSYRELKTFVRDRPGHDRRYAIDPARLEARFGWRARHPFEDGLRDTVRWYLDHSDWCESVQSGRYRRERLGLGD